MVAGILLIGLVAFGLSWLFGFGKPERLVKFIVWLIFGPVLLGVFYSEWSNFFSSLPFFGQIAFLIIIPFILLLALHMFFPNSSLIRGIVDFIWNMLVFLLSFPVRLLWRSGKHISNTERNRIRLQRYRPSVGGRPPLRNDRETDVARRHN